jgi:hypothetical protein
MIRKFCLSTFCIFILALIFSLNPGQCYGFEITIDIAPNILNIQSQGEVVTVHTDINYNEVYASAIYLDDVLINSWKADNRGNFVAKFIMNDIKNQVDVGYNTLTLIGTTKDGTLFWGAQTILVVNNIPAGKE